MANNTKIIFDVQANIDQLKNSASEISNVFSKLNLPQNIQKSFTGTFNKLTAEIRDFETAANKGFNTLIDATKAEKSIDKIITLFENLKVQAKDIGGMDLSKFIPDKTLTQLKQYKGLLSEVEKLQKRDNSAAIKKAGDEAAKAAKRYQELSDKVKGFEDAKKSAQNDKDTASTEYIRLKTSIEAARAAQAKLIEEGKKEGKSETIIQRSNQYQTLKQQIKELESDLNTQKKAINDADSAISSYDQKIAQLSPSLLTAKVNFEELEATFQKIKNSALVSEEEIQNLVNKLAEISGLNPTQLPNNLQDITTKIQQLVAESADTSQIVEQIRQLGENCGTAANQANNVKVGIQGIVTEKAGIAQMNSEMDQLKTRLGYFFSLVNGVQLFKRAIRSAYESVKELDEAMTDTAVVTKYNVSDLWKQMPIYVQEANELGATTLDVYKSMTLYYQQGLDNAEATALSTQTLKMARIAGMEAADATDAMTSALRGFNMELTEASGQRINDVYSNLAAHAAANTEEISNAMMRTASIAHSAGMEFETTAAFLTQMIESTREPAENLGTAMKTIVARFTEMKKAPTDIIDIDGEEVSVNKVDKALQSVGVSLKNANGEFRDLDDVFLDLSKKWDSLDIMQQRYVATMAAGSRQQSRFIAMMSNYQRTMELTGYATNSAGASQQQFEKTMESLEAKLNRLHNAWEEFTTGIANSTVIKGAVDLLTNLLNAVNKVTDALDPLDTGITKVFAAILGFKAGKKIINSVFSNIGATIARSMGKEGEKAGASFYQRFTKSIKFRGNELNLSSLTKQFKAYSKEAAKQTKIAAYAKEQSQSYKQLSQQYSQFAAAQKAGIATEEQAQALHQADVALRGEQAAAVSLETSAEDANAIAKQLSGEAAGFDGAALTAETKAKEANAAATAINTTMTEADTIAENANNMTRLKAIISLFSFNSSKRMAAALSLGLATAEEIEAIATEGAAGAQTAFNAALYSCPIMWIIAGVAALTAGIIALSIAIANQKTEYEKQQEYVKTIGEITEKTTEQATEAKDAYEDLLENRNTYNQLYEELERLGKGTEEFKNKALELKDIVNDLLLKYPELYNYVKYQNGLVTLSNIGWEEALKKVENTKNATAMANAAMNAYLEIEKAKTVNMKHNSESIAYYAGTKKEPINEDSKIYDTSETGVDYHYYHNATLTSDYLNSLRQYYNKNKDKIQYSDKEIWTEQDVPSGYVLLNEYNGQQIIAPESILDYKYVKPKSTGDNTTVHPWDFELDPDKGEGSNFYKIELTSGDIVRELSVLREKEKANVEAVRVATYQYESQLFEGLSNLGNYTDEFINNYSKFMGEQNANELVNTADKLEEQINTLKSKDIYTLLSLYYDKFNTDFEIDEDIDLSDQNSDEVKKIKEQISSIISVYDVFNEFVTQDIASIEQIRKEGKLSKYGDYLKIVLGDTTENLSTELIEALLDSEQTAENYFKDLADKINTDNIDEYWSNAQDTIQKRFDTLKSFFNMADEELSSFISKVGADSAYNLANSFENLRINTGRDFSGVFEKYQELLFSSSEDISDFAYNFNNINWNSPVEAAYALNNVDNKFSAIAQEIKTITAALIGTREQFGEVFNSIDSDTWEDLLEDGEVTRDEIEDLKDDLPVVAKALKNTGISSSTLATYLNKVNEGLIDTTETSLNFVTALDKISAATNNMEKALEFVQDFEPSDSLTEIGDSFAEYRENMAQSLERGQYGDQQLIDYTKMILGTENYEKYYDEFNGNLQKIEELAYEKVNTFGQNFYGLWQTLASQTDAITLTAENGIQFDLSGFSSLDDLKQLIMDKLDVSEEFAEAAIADAQTYSNNLTQELNKLSIGDSLAELLKGSQKSLDGSTYLLDENELRILAEQVGMELDEFRTIIEEAANNANISVEIGTNIKLENGKLSQKDFTNYFEYLKSELESGAKSVDFSSIYQNLLATGMDSEAAREQVRTFLESLQSELSSSSFRQKGSKLTLVDANTVDTVGIQDSMIEGIVGGVEDKAVDAAEMEAQLEAEKETATSIANGIIAGLNASKDTIISFISAIASAFGKEISTESIKAINTSLQNVDVSGAISELFKADEQAVAEAKAAETQLGTDATNFGSSITTSLQSALAEAYSNAVAQLAGISGGSWPDDSSSSNNDNDDDDWTNDWNRQYALLKKIEALERERNKLDKEHDRWVKSYALMESDIVKNKEKQRKNLMKQIELNKDLAQQTRNELESLNWYSGFGGSIWYDQENNMIRTNDEHIRSMDKETKEAFDDVKSQYESLASQLEDAQDNIESAVEAIEELTSAITEIDYQTQLDSFIKIIDHTLSLYDKAIARLDRPGNTPTKSKVLNLFNAASKERVEKNKTLTESYIRSGAQLNALLNLSDYKKYFSFDWDTGKLTRNSAYYSLGDSDLKDKIDTHLTKIEDLAEQRRTADEEREDLADEQYEAEKAIAEKANEWQKNVYDAVVSEREEQISKLETINTSIQDASSKLIDSMQKSIQKIRQDRKNEKTEEELSDMQSKLAYLQADTSGANEVEIKKLQKQLTEKQESYTDTLIDQKITELQDQNKEAAEQRKQQIEIAKAQLQYDKQTGAIWSEVRGLIAIGLSSNGTINKNSELGKLLTKWGNVNSLSAYDKSEYWSEQGYGSASYSANQSITSSGGYQNQFGYTVTNGQYNSMRNNMIKEAKAALSDYVNNTTPYKNYMRYDSSKNTLIQTELFPYPEGDEKALHDTLEAAWQSIWERINYINGLIGYFNVNSANTSFTHTPSIARHAKGGLVDYTGLHWLDGTTSEPELVLNAKDTKNFLALKDILSGVMKNSSTIPHNNGDVNCEITINVDSISNDYDVDQIAKRIEYNIMQSANWRNVNNLSMMR